MKILRVLLTTTVVSVDVTFLREGVVGALQLPGPGSVFLCFGHCLQGALQKDRRRRGAAAEEQATSAARLTPWLSAAMDVEMEPQTLAGASAGG
jgi:hypothetical protein